MKKTAFLLAALLCAGGVSMAKIPVDDAALGGISPGVTKDYVISIYGEPEEGKIENAWAWGPDSKSQIIKYGNTVSMNCVSDNNGPMEVMMIYVTANNGFSTPRGIHVGSTEREVRDAYGTPDLNSHNDLWYKTISNGMNLVFHMKNGKVNSISVGWNA